MKILAIIGSPRKQGNSYQVTRRLEEKMTGLGKVEFSYLFLADANLEPCRGCFACIAKGETLCPLKDDRDRILGEMLAADGLILVSPVYFFNVSALMKGFIDRYSYLTHRPALAGKPALAIATSSGAGLKETLKYFETVAAGWELRLVHKLGVWTPPYLLSPRIVIKTEREIAAAARQFYQALADESLPSPGLGSLLHFRFMRYHALLEKEHFPADYDYFKERGLLAPDKKYYIPARINPARNAVAALLERAIRPQMRRALMK